VECAQRRRLTELGAVRRPVQTRALHRPQPMAEGKSFQPAALSSQRPLHHGARRDLVGRKRRKFDPDNSVAMLGGTFVTQFGKQVHWDGAKNEDASLLIVGNGPATSSPVEQEPASSPVSIRLPSSTRRPTSTNGAIPPALPASTRSSCMATPTRPGSM